MTSLASYLAGRNSATLAWVAEDPANRWAGTYTEDLAHWAEIGILTVLDLKRYEMQTSYWDLHKDVYGFRPRGMDIDCMTYEELEQDYNYLLTQLDRAIEADAEWDRQEEEYRLEQEAEHAAWLAEQPEAIDYVACHYQEGWL
jgi:hypothetical protein